MTLYSAEELEIRILGASSSRRTWQKEKYSNDDEYWTGGQCNWGGTHNLKEDCRKLVKFFDEITELRNARKELMNFTNEGEFNKVKKNLIIKNEKIISNLTREEGANTYIADICCIWSDFDKLLGDTIDSFRNAAELLKRDIEVVPYNEIKELQKLNSDERKLKNEIEENERKARNEPDENKRKKFIFLVNEAKERLKKNLERKKQLKTAHLGDDFNPDQHIENFFQTLEGKLSGKNRPPKPTRTNTGQQQSSFGNPSGSNSTTQNTNYNGYSPNYNSNNNESKSLLEKHWRELLFAGFFLLGIYYILNQPDYE